VRYFPRQLLTADDMRTEQAYFRQKQRRHNRLLHGWGVVCGLEVVADPATGPLVVNVCPGYALGPCGDEIYLADPFKLDLTHCTRPAGDPCVPKPAAAALAGAAADPQPTLIVRIRYAECPTRPMRTLPAGCGCDETACEYSRIRDGFEIQCIQKSALAAPLAAAPLAAAVPVAAVAPVGKAAPAGKAAAAALTGCPPCPDDPWLLLASVQNPAGALQIDGTIRKILAVAQ
jgi:hypothetical protein